MTTYREQVSASEQALDRRINIAAGRLQRLHIGIPIKEALQPCTYTHSAGANPHGQRDLTYAHRIVCCQLVYGAFLSGSNIEAMANGEPKD